MRTKLLSVVGMGLLLSISSLASADTLTFDDIAADGIGSIPNGYGGFDWNDFGYIKNGYYNDSGYNNGVVSGDYVAYNEYAQVATVTDTLFNFDGAYLTAAWNNGLSIDVKGYLNNVEIYSQTVVVDTTGPTWFEFNYDGVDAVTFSSYGGVDAGLDGGGTHFAMDDFTFNGEVPTPSSLAALLGMGVMGMIAVRRRRKRA